MHPIKISIVGSGQIGSTIALLLGEKDYCNVVLVDIIEGIPQGKALDLNHCLTALNCSCIINGTNDFGEIKNSDVVIITAGVPRKPNMSRSDLLSINAKIVKSVAESVKTYCPNAFIICITNPLDAMVWYFSHISGIPTNRICGMSGLLDSSRFRYFLSQELNVSPKDISAIVIGGHGDSMIPLSNSITVSGIPISVFIENGTISKTKISEIIEKTKNAGGDIVNLLKNSSAYFAPAISAILMAESFLFDKKSLIVCCAFPNGKYNVRDICIGVPTIIGKQGIEQIVDVNISNEEKEQFEHSSKLVQELIDAIKEIELTQ